VNPGRWEQIDQLLQSALSRRPADRAAFVDEACGGDESLRREVTSLLEAHGRSGPLDDRLSQVAEDVLPPRDATALEGRSFGPYRVMTRLGAGGMGEVYRARDTRIGRDVALKVLPDDYAVDPDRVRRFEQEARAAGALNHPNILTLHDVGHHDGTPYLVAELLEGETLRDRIGRGPLPWRKAAETAAAIAEGLAAAHAKGIVHRDLKPENVFLTRDGRVKVLDFGLAKLREVTPPAGSATRTAEKTAPGQVLGTVGYMSPEQVAGAEADTRSDLFSLGCMLYEMAAGQRAFKRATPAETMAAIRNDDPPAADAVPAELRRIVAHCLEKEPDARFQSARDLAFNLRGLLEVDLPASALRRKSRPGPALAVLAATASLGALLAARFLDIRGSRPAADAIRFTVAPSEGGSLVGIPQISPDGRRLLSPVRTAERSALWLRPLGAAAGQVVPGTDGANGLTIAWSPDSRFAVFGARLRLLRIDMDGPGSPTVLTDTDIPLGWGVTVNQEGLVLIGRDGSGIHRVPPTGGAPSLLLPVDEASQEYAHYWPHFLPDGRHFLFFARNRNPAENALCAASLDGRTRKRLLTGVSQAQYASGHLFYAEGRTLFARPFDPDALEFRGDPVPVAEKVGRGSYGIAAFSVSQTGALAYRTSFGFEAELVWFDRHGKRLSAVGPPGDYADPELSPDGRQVAVDRSEDGASRDIWTVDVEQGRLMRLTFDPEMDHIPSWSPDGTRIVFDSHRTGAGDLYEKAANGSGPEQLLLSWKDGTGMMDWSPDGRFIAFSSGTPSTLGDMWILPLDGDRKPFPYLQTKAREGSGRFSPDGRWMAYVSHESGQPEVYVQAFRGAPAGTGGKWQVSSGGGGQPAWRRDGRELFYLSGPDARLMAVEVKTGETFEAGSPRVLFDTGLAAARRGPRNDYSASPDGQRFLLRVPTSAAAEPVQVLVNWPALLKR
jgi:serine/threonine protein kinase/Tol biopolymer transport system component